MVDKTKDKVEAPKADSQVAVDRNAQDYLDPSINVSEPEVPMAQKPVDPDAPTAEEIAKAEQLKREKYQAEADEAQGVTRSAVDKGQESHLSPEAKAQLEKSQGKHK